MFSQRFFLFGKLHSSTLIAFFSCGVVGGVALSLLWRYYFFSFSWLVLALVLIGLCTVRRHAWLVVIIILAGVIIGLWRGDNQLLKIKRYEPYIGQTVIVSGSIYEDVRQSKQGDVQIVLSNVQINGRQLPEKVWLSVHTKATLKRSDMIVAEGMLKPGFGNFVASMNFARVLNHKRGIDEARDIRDRFADKIRKVLPEPEASLGLGFLVGQRSSLPPELDTQLRVVGLTHIVVASGYNLTILVRLARRLLSKISKYLTAALSLVMMSGFMLVTGFSPSMSRAGLVAGLSLGAWYYGRRISPFVLLPFVSAITLLVNPSFAWGDAGWYLSFAAFGGVMIVGPLLQHYFFGKEKPNFVRQVLGETVAALLVTAPIIMWVFQQYSLYALLSNLLVVPIIPIIMLAVFIVGIVEVVVPIAAPFVSLPATGLLQYVTNAIDWIAHFPGAQLDITINTLTLIGYYIVLIFICFYMWLKTKHDFSKDNVIE